MTGPSISRVRDLRLALGWGALWGAALGLWLVAPSLVALHRLVPRSASEWLVLEGGLVALFATGGALLGVVAGTPLVVWRNGRGKDYRDASVAFALAMPPLLIVVYLVWSAGIEWFALRGLSVVAAYRPVFARLAVMLLAWAAASFLAYRILVRAPRPARRAIAISLVGGLALAGGGALAARGEAPAPPAESLPPLVPLRPAADRSPTLFVGIDGANWRTLRPLLDRGALPTLGGLAERGVAGDVTAIWPPHWSAPAWAAILSGHPREETGIYEDLAVLAPGLPPFQAPLVLDLVLNPIFSMELLLAKAGILRLAHPTREMLRHPPFWEPLTDAGVRTAVVRFRFTFPADGAANVLVTDWAGEDQWSVAGVHLAAPPEALAAPAGEAEELLDPFRDGVSPAPPLDRFVPDPGRAKPSDAAIHPIEMLRFAADIDARTLEASHRILQRRPDTEILAVYLGGLDTVQHAFWQYRFPEDFPADPPASRDVAELGAAPDRYLLWIDEELGRLIAAFPSPPNVVVVSDHGYEAIHDHALWKGWHAADGGIFLAAGPDVPNGQDRREVSYLDIAPTLIGLAGFAPPAALPGTPLF